MTSKQPYLIPAEALHRTEIVVVNSRFITSIAPAPTVDEAKAFLKMLHDAMPDANHHVYAFRVGYGSSVIEGMSDAGEPSGTAGPPVLAVLRGTEIGDVIVVVTRYFGGTKLGTGGLVRAYSDAAREGLSTLKTELKLARTVLGIDISYSLYDQMKRLISTYNGEILDETFTDRITVMARFVSEEVEGFSLGLRDLSNGQVEAVLIDQD